MLSLKIYYSFYYELSTFIVAERLFLSQKIEFEFLLVFNFLILGMTRQYRCESRIEYYQSILMTAMIFTFTDNSVLMKLITHAVFAVFLFNGVETVINYTLMPFFSHAGLSPKPVFYCYLMHRCFCSLIKLEFNSLLSD